MIFIAHKDGCFTYAGRQVRCALGRAGVIDASLKAEGDGASPIGTWPIRRVLYRADRVAAPRTTLSVSPIAQDDGWCDAPADPFYNRPVKLPYPASHEELWRQDGLYDIVVVLGHNDAPPVAGKGSAIFMHCAKADYSPTAGCVALAKADLLAALKEASPGDAVEIRAD